MLLSIEFLSHLEDTVIPDSHWHRPMTTVDSDMGWMCGLHQRSPSLPSKYNSG